MNKKDILELKNVLRKITVHLLKCVVAMLMEKRISF